MTRILVGILLFTSYATASDSISPASVDRELSAFIAASKPNRTVGSPGHAGASAYLETKFKQLAAKAGGKVYEHAFSPDVEFAAKHYADDFANQIEGKVPPSHPEYIKWRAFTDHAIAFVRGFKAKPGRNLILEFKGTAKADEVLYIGAHYDSITHDHASMRFTPDAPTEGADDNASGIAALLLIASELAASPPERTVRLVAFDFEEIFFLGSLALARDLSAGKLAWEGGRSSKKERVIGLLNLEMIGWSKSGKAMKLYIRPPSEKGAQEDQILARVFKDAAAKSSIKPEIVANGFDRSDHWSFWQAGIPAICITQDWENDFNEANYHTSHDAPSKLNRAYLAEIARATLAAAKILLKVK